MAKENNAQKLGVIVISPFRGKPAMFKKSALVLIAILQDEVMNLQTWYKICKCQNLPIDFHDQTLKYHCYFFFCGKTGGKIHQIQ